MDFPDLKAKMSVIDRDELLTKKVEQPYNMPPKQVFYPRSLNVKDIEGTQVGSLNTKFIKNWQLAQELKAGMQPREKMSLDLHYPYGDGVNYEEAMPENLKRAREMAGRNRNKLRLINTMEKGYREGVTNDRFVGNEEKGAQPSVQYGSENRLGYQRDNNRPEIDGYRTLDKQYGDSKATYERLRELNYRNAPINYEANPHNQELPDIRQRGYDQRSTDGMNNQYNNFRAESKSQPLFKRPYPSRSDIGERKIQLPSIESKAGGKPQEDIDRMNLNNEDLLRDIAMKERYLKELDEKIRRERAEIEAIGNLNTRQPPSLEPYISQKPNQNDHFDQLSQEKLNLEYQDIAQLQKDTGKPTYQKVTFKNEGPQSDLPLKRPENNPYERYNTEATMDKGYGGHAYNENQTNNYRQKALDSRLESASPIPEQDIRTEYPPREMFRNTDEFKHFSRYAVNDQDYQKIKRKSIWHHF